MPLRSFLFQFPVFLIGVLMGALLVVGCAGNKSAPLAERATISSEAPQDSLRAKFKLTIFQNDDRQELDAVLFSVPGKRYRMELTGPMGVGVASMLWTEDGWTMTFPTEKLYVKGKGYMVGLLNDKSLPLVHIHQVASLFDGQMLPEKFERIDSLDHVVNAVDGSGRQFSYTSEGSRVTSLSYAGRDGKTETLRFMDYREFEGRNLPETIAFERGEKRFLEIKIKKVTHNKAFSGGTWKLTVPRSFKPVEQ